MLWLVELFHELETDASGCGDERDSAAAERALDHGGAPHHVVAPELGLEVVGEERRVQEPFVGQRDRVLVDRTREERDLHRSEEHVGALAVVPADAVAYLRTGLLVERARGV